jgi:hypothetical protein
VWNAGSSSTNDKKKGDNQSSRTDERMSHLHDHQILIDLSGDGAEEGGEFVLSWGDFTMSGMR